MEIEKGHIVRSLAGRDAGRLFIVMETEENFVYLADGRLRKLDAKKKKKRKHAAFVARLDTPLLHKIQTGGKVLDSEIRKALAGYVKSVDGEESKQA